MNRIRAIMAEKNISQEQLGLKLKVSQAAISKFVSEKSNLSRKTLERIANALQVRVFDLIGEPGNLEPFRLPAEMGEIPVYASISGGNGEIGVTDELLGYMATSKQFEKSKSFGFRVTGESMNGPEYGIRNGSYAFFQPVDFIPWGKGCCVWVQGWENCCLKIIEKAPDGKIILRSDNPDPVYSPIKIDPEEKRYEVKGIFIYSIFVPVWREKEIFSR